MNALSLWLTLLILYDSVQMWVRLLIAACFGPVSVVLTLLRKCLQSICAPRPSPGPAVCSSCPTQHKHSTRVAPSVGVLFIKCLPIAQVRCTPYTFTEL